MVSVWGYTWWRSCEGVEPNLPARFAEFAAYGDLATGVLAMMALLTVGIRLLAVRRRLQSRGGGRHSPRPLQRHPGRPSRAGGRVGRHVRNPDHLRARAGVASPRDGDALTKGGGWMLTLFA